MLGLKMRWFEHNRAQQLLGAAKVGLVGDFVSAAEMLHSRLAKIEADVNMTASEKVGHFLDAVVVAEAWYKEEGESWVKPLSGRLLWRLGNMAAFTKLTRPASLPDTLPRKTL